MINQKEVYKEITELVKMLNSKGNDGDVAQKNKLKEKLLELLVLATPNIKEYNFITAFVIASEYANRHWKTESKGFLSIFEDEDSYLFERNIDPELAKKGNECVVISKNNLFNFASFNVSDSYSAKIINNGRQIPIGDVATMSKRVLNRDLDEEFKMFEAMLNNTEKDKNKINELITKIDNENNINELKDKIDKRLEELNAQEDEKKQNN